jgi:hypothetical protein
MKTNIQLLLELCERHGIEDLDVDPLVHDMVQEKGLDKLNEAQEDEAQEDLISSGEKFASNINNKGLESQLKFLLENDKFFHIQHLLLELKREK